MWNLADILGEIQEDLYAILGVEPSADLDTIKKAYRQRALESHPDRNPGDPTAEERFKQVAAAYYVLSDPGRRQDYDMSRGRVWTGPGVPGSGKSRMAERMAREWGMPYVVININEMDLPEELRTLFNDLMNIMGGAASSMDEDFKTRRAAACAAKRRRTRATKAKNSKILDSLVVNFVLAHGGEWRRNRRTGEIDKALGLVLPTMLGPLHVTPYGDWIACRWENVKAACDYFGVPSYMTMGPHRLNPCSGKWNFMGNDEMSPEDLFTAWRQEVEPLLVTGPDEADDATRRVK